MKRHIFTALLIISFPLTSFAQISSSAQKLDVSVFPQHPKPNETVTLKVVVYGPTLDVSSVVWQVDGTKIAEGTTEAQFTAGELGSVHSVSVRGLVSTGRTLTENFLIIPGQVDLTFEADNQTPPFYKGHSLLTKESGATVYATAYVVSTSGSILPTSALNFTWEVGNTVDFNQSGLGKSSIKFDTGILPNKSIVSVKVAPAKGAGGIAEDRIDIPIIDSEALIYENNPLYGKLFNRALKGDYVLKEKEVTLFAFPLFFSKSNQVSYKWKVGGQEVPAGLASNQNITFRSDESSGESSVSVGLTNTGSVLQKAESFLKLIFN